MPRPRTDGDEGFRLDGIELVRGKRSETRLRVLELADATWLELPVIVLRGAKPGPVFYLGAAFHGDEVNGVDIATRFAGEVNLAQLRGTLIVVPAQNPLALQAQHRYFVGHFLKSPLDQSPADPWVSFPGDADGNIAAQIAHTLFDRLMRHARYLIDIHTPTTGGRYAPFAFLPPPDIGAAAEAAEAMAKIFGADFILSTREGLYVSEQSPHVVLARRGATAIGIELGEGGRLERAVSEQGLKGLPTSCARSACCRARSRASATAGSFARCASCVPGAAASSSAASSSRTRSARATSSRRSPISSASRPR